MFWGEKIFKIQLTKEGNFFFNFKLRHRQPLHCMLAVQPFLWHSSYYSSYYYYCYSYRFVVAVEAQHRMKALQWQSHLTYHIFLQTFQSFRCDCRSLAVSPSHFLSSPLRQLHSAYL